MPIGKVGGIHFPSVDAPFQATENARILDAVVGRRHLSGLRRGEWLLLACMGFAD